MSDNIVTILLEYLPGLLAEAHLLHGVEDQVNSILRKLRLMNIFLQNSEGKRNEHDIVQEVVRQIRDVAHEVEDVIDTYLLTVAEQRKRNVLGKIIHIFKHTTTVHLVAKKIEGLSKEINKIYDNITKYGIERTEARVDVAAEEALHKRRRDVEEDDVVGFAHDSATLVEQLTDQGNPSLDVISIIGMGGLGKTTLARKLYNNHEVKSHFPYRAWVYVSQDFQKRDLLLKILKSVAPGIEKPEEMKEDELKNQIRVSLEGKKYLIVMDDIWGSEVWDEVRTAFPPNSRSGSRILITSRIKEVALHAGRNPPYLLPVFNRDESWELFCKKVFRGENCPADLETLGRKLVESCHGLPLSIVVLGGLLAKKEKTQLTWSRLVGHVNSCLTHDTTICKDILALSYTHLPRRLKPCFIYFGMFPEDFEIPVRQLIELWIAEGFIQYTGSREKEEVAEDYLEELIDRSLIQVARRRTDGGVKTCRIHDLLRDLCISEGKEDKFLEVSTNVNPLNTNKSRRLSIQGGLSRYMSLNSSDRSYARSLLCFYQESDDRYEGDLFEWIARHFKLIRVLLLDTYEIEETVNVEKLIHLRYLRIRCVGLGETIIPASIQSLSNLETLDLRGCYVESLPDGIWNMQRLRNLYLPEADCVGEELSLPNPSDKEIKPLLNLQVLSNVSFDPKNVCLIEEGKIPNLRKLGMCCPSDESDPRAEEVLASLRHLRRLQKLKIISFLKLPRDPNSFPSSITKITLFDMDLGTGGGMAMLGNLQYLQKLKLERCHFDTPGVRILHVEEGSFPRLEVLKLSDLLIEKWIHEKDAMRRLRHLDIQFCKYDGWPLPEELKSLTALQYVKGTGVDSMFASKFRQLQMQLGIALDLYCF